MEGAKSVENLVVDSSAFIKNIKIENIGEKLFTIHEVVSEIRDSNTRQRLQILPYELHFKAPTAEILKMVSEFSKKTGDYISLSATDLKLIALCYQLEKEFNNGDASHLKTEPTFGVEILSSKQSLDNVKNIVGFYSGHKHTASSQNSAKTSISEQNEEKSESEINMDDLKVEDLVGNSEGESGGTSESESESDDEADWITPNNLADILRENGLGFAEKDEIGKIGVACLTTDFAMQNVLLHMGLKVVSTEGMLIKRLKNFVLRCHACFKTTSIMSNRFCPACGNETLDKVSVTVDQQGNVQYNYSNRRRKKKMLTAHLPPPRGGKHVFNAQHAPDVTQPKNQLSRKARQRIDPLDEDYVARDSPFVQRDLNSKSAMLGLGCRVGRNNRTPNETGNKKKRGGKRR